MRLYENNYEEFSLSFISYLEEGTDIWFVTENWNAIFKMNKESYTIEYCGFFEKYIGRAVNGYREMVRWKRKVLAVPVTTDCDLCIMEGMDKKYLPFPKVGGEYAVQRTILVRRYAFIITTNEKNAVLRLDMEDNTIDMWIDFSQCNVHGKIEKWLLGGIWQENDWIYCTIRNSNSIAKISTCEKKLEYCKLEEKLSSECHSIEDSIWAVTEDRKRIVQLRDEKILSKIEITEYVQNYSFFGFAMSNRMLWLFPNNNEDIIKIDIERKEKKVLKYPNTFGWIDDARYRRGCRFYCYDDNEKKIILYPRSGNGILIIDKNTDEMNHIPLTMNMRALINKQVKQVGAENINTWENDLKGYMNLIMESQSDYEIKSNAHSIGERIFRACY